VYPRRLSKAAGGGWRSTIEGGESSLADSDEGEYGLEETPRNKNSLKVYIRGRKGGQQITSHRKIVEIRENHRGRKDIWQIGQFASRVCGAN